MSQEAEYQVTIAIEGPVMENMSRVTVSTFGGDETFYVNHDDMEEFDEPELKIELIMEFGNTQTRNSIFAAETITMNDEPVDMDAVKSVLEAVQALKR